MNKVLIAIAAIFLCTATIAKAKTDDTAKVSQESRGVFIKEGAARIEASGKVSDSNKSKLRNLVSAYQKEPSDDNWKILYETAIKAASDAGLKCSTTVITKPNDQASIKMQLVGRHEVTSAGTSKFTQDIDFGIYHIWAVRNEKATTSQTDEYNLLVDSKQITLHEE